MTNETTHDDIINKEIEEEHEFMRARIKELENKPTYPFNEAFNKQLQEENQKLKELNNALSGQLNFVKSELELRLSTEIKRSKFILGEFKKTDKQRDYWRETAENIKQALDEIKELIPKFDNSTECAYGDFDCENCSSLDEDTVCTYKLKKIILDIINKANGDHDE